MGSLPSALLAEPPLLLASGRRLGMLNEAFLLASLGRCRAMKDRRASGGMLEVLCTKSTSVGYWSGLWEFRRRCLGAIEYWSVWELIHRKRSV